jgi:hypothetical protein
MRMTASDGQGDRGFNFLRRSDYGLLAARFFIEDRGVRKSLLAGRCAPKLENPIMERIIESESSSDIFVSNMIEVSAGYGF